MIVTKKNFLSEVQLFENGFISVYENYLKISFTNYNSIELLLKNHKNYTIVPNIFYYFIKNTTFNKTIIIYFKDFDPVFWKKVCYVNTGENKYYYKEINNYYKSIFKLKMINNFNNEKLQWNVHHSPVIYLNKPLFIKNCILLHYKNKIIIYFEKNNTFIALKILRLKTFTSFGDFYNYLTLNLYFNNIKINIKNYSDFEILNIINKISINNFYFEFSFEKIENHELLINHLIICHNKNELEEDILYETLNYLKK